MAKTQKERLKEAHNIYENFFYYCDSKPCSQYDNEGLLKFRLLKFRKWVLKREREAIKKYKNTTCNHAWNYTENHCLKCGEVK